MAKTSLLAMHREFLPTMEDAVNDNAIFFSMSAMRLKFMLNNEEKVVLHWQAHFNIRSDNTRIRLHSPDEDPGLLKMEAKLILLKESLEFFITEQKRRMKKPGGEKLSKRIWLNEDETGHYTGYCFYQLEPWGSGVFYIADCHRTLNYHLDVYRKGEKWGDQRNTFTHQQHRLFGGIIKNINLFLKKLEGIRKQVKAGALGDDVGKDNWGGRNIEPSAV